MAVITVFGASHGLGLATAKRLCDDGFTVELVGRDFSFAEEVFSSILIRSGRIRLIQHDFLLDDLQALFLKVNEDPLMVFYTAGVGRLEFFANISNSDIRSSYIINSEIPALLVKRYYPKLSGDKDFYFGCVTSIAGQLASPLFSVYAASKAATSRLVESVNAELAACGSVNRITDFCPGEFSGSSFAGGDTDLSKLVKLANELIDATRSRKWLFIPDYEEIYKPVLERYRKGIQAFGVESYEFKVSRVRRNV